MYRRFFVNPLARRRQSNKKIKALKGKRNGECQKSLDWSYAIIIIIYRRRQGRRREEHTNDVTTILFKPVFCSLVCFLNGNFFFFSSLTAAKNVS